MSGDGYFDRLDAELAALTRRGAHLPGGAPGLRARVALVRARRIVTALSLSVALAVTLVSEFPASAHGQAPHASRPVMSAES